MAAVTVGTLSLSVPNNNTTEQATEYSTDELPADFQEGLLCQRLDSAGVSPRVRAERENLCLSLARFGVLRPGLVISDMSW